MLQQEIRDEVLETKALMLLVEKLRGKRAKTDKQIKKEPGFSLTPKWPILRP